MTSLQTTQTLDASHLPLPDGSPAPEQEALHVNLWLHDPEVVGPLLARPEGRSRDDLVRSGLKIGILAIRQAQGRMDSEAIRKEGERLIEVLETRLSNHQSQVSSVLTTTLKDYFDPSSGRFNERVERLVKQDGDLERIMRGEVDAAGRALKAALDEYLGASSVFARLLTPDDSNALLAAIRSTIDGILDVQQERVLSQFSLDNKQGALSRLLQELLQSHGQLTGDLKASIQRVVAEFSLDRDDLALSRLVKRVEEAQRQISSEFTLDSEESALSRMKRDLLDVINGFHKDSIEFQKSVIAALGPVHK